MRFFREGLQHACRLSKTSRWIVFIASIPLICVALYLAWAVFPGDEPPPTYVAIAFAGYTNDARGQALPQFSVSNVSAFRIQCSPLGLQVQVTNAMRGILTNVVWGWSAGFGSRFLDPGEVNLVSVQPPASGVPWRFGVFALRPLSLWQPAADKMQPKLPAAVYSMVRGNRRRTQLVQSAVFNPSEKLSSAEN
jgi:hypothetical protein